MDENKKQTHFDEFDAAFNRLKTDLQKTNSNEDVIRVDDVKVSADDVFVGTKQSEDAVLNKEHTIFARKLKKDETQRVDKPAAAGVIDKDEWDEMLRALENKPIKPAEEGEEVVEAAAAVVGTRATRNASKKLKKKKNSKSAKKAKAKRKKIFTRIILALLCLCFVAAIAAGVIVIKIIKETPEINPNNIYSMLSQSSVIYDINGNTVDNIYSGDALRTNVEYSEIPQQLIDAFVCIEDKTFWTHHGFNIIRMGGAIWQRLTGQSDRIGGTSTITQQLARNIYLVDTKSSRGLEGIIRKIREAYYTLEIEKTLSKEQIIEAYLNTVYLGFNSNGIYAASKAYFNKDIQDLTLIECAQLAALPQSPNNYAPLKRVATDSVTDIDSLDVVTSNDTWITYYNDAGANRIKLVLRYMHDQEKLDDATYEAAKETSIRDYLNPGVNIGNAANDSSYFTDYIVSEVMSDLQKKLGYTYEEAHDLLYNGGLVVNSTLDMDIQVLLEGVYADESNFPKIKLSAVGTDKEKNILNADRDKVVLYAFNNMINEDGDFILRKEDYKWNDNGSLTLIKGKRLNFYNTKSNGVEDVRIDIKDMYEMIEDQLYSRSSSNWTIASKYKSRDKDGNVVISADCFADLPEAFTKHDDGTITLASKYFNLGSQIIQPQSAMVIVDNASGQVRAMIGGRNIKGKLLYNRATSTRQPGSSIKPLALYSTALQKGYEASLAKAAGEEEYGTIFTAATPVDNIPSNAKYDLWPKNSDGGYAGNTYMRKALEQSWNGSAVSLYNMLDPQDCVNNLLNYGITSLVLDGDETDVNASALALGGMTKGISPLEEASAYSTFGNYGVHNEHTCYTTVTNRKGDVILTAENHPVKVLDEPVASLMCDMLQSVVNHGIAGSAKLKSQPNGGKTGTTSDAYDIWFSGLTPKYAASVWIGCDTNIKLGTSSGTTAKLWKAVMEKVGQLDERQEFEMRGEFVTVTVDAKTGMLPSQSEYADIPEEDLRSEIFIKGTEPTEANDNARGYVQVCSATGYLATPYCPTAYKYYVERPGGLSWETLLANYTLLKGYKQGADPTALEEQDKTQYLNIIPDANLDPPQFYCPIHGHYSEEDYETYPISPIVREEYNVEGLLGGEEYYTEDGEGTEEPGTESDMPDWLVVEDEN